MLNYARTPLAEHPDAKDILCYELPFVVIGGRKFDPKRNNPANKDIRVLYHRLATKLTASAFPDLVEDMEKFKAKVLELYPRCEELRLYRISEWVAPPKRKK